MFRYEQIRIKFSSEYLINLKKFCIGTDWLQFPLRLFDVLLTSPHGTCKDYCTTGTGVKCKKNVIKIIIFLSRCREQTNKKDNSQQITHSLNKWIHAIFFSVKSALVFEILIQKGVRTISKSGWQHYFSAFLLFYIDRLNDIIRL